MESRGEVHASGGAIEDLLELNDVQASGGAIEERLELKLLVSFVPQFGATEDLRDGELLVP